MPETKTIELALQGGGAHGAFTWGVLDRLLEDERIQIEGICGTSAGAMNGVVVADGLEQVLAGGEQGREILALAADPARSHARTLDSGFLSRVHLL